MVGILLCSQLAVPLVVLTPCHAPGCVCVQSSIYTEAARVLSDVVSHRKGLKTAALADEELPCKVCVCATSWRARDVLEV